MKKITMFHIEECKYCDYARQAIAELREENPDYKNVEIEMIKMITINTVDNFLYNVKKIAYNISGGEING